jgi:hypothetical protein
MDHECGKNSTGGAYSRKKSLLPHSYYAFMSVVDRVLLEISRVIEAVFDGIEYRNAKVARGRAAKQSIAISSSGISQHESHVDLDNSASVDISTRDFG